MSPSRKHDRRKHENEALMFSYFRLSCFRDGILGQSPPSGSQHPGRAGARLKSPDLLPQPNGQGPRGMSGGLSASPRDRLEKTAFSGTNGRRTSVSKNDSSHKSLSCGYFCIREGKGTRTRNHRIHMRERPRLEKRTVPEKKTSQPQR